MGARRERCLLARYLVVAHQTADSPELVAALEEIRRREPDAVFVLLVPATPVQHLAGWTEGESHTVAAQTGEQARERLLRRGIDLEAVRVGDPSPLEAVEDELMDHPDYQAVVVSTLPRGVSRWLKRDVIGRIERKVGLPVSHVIGSQ